MKTTETRSYTMSARAKAVAQTEQNILQAAFTLWCELALHEITLDAIAERAGVTVRTVLRKHGSKEGVFAACLERFDSPIETMRDQTPVGDIGACLHSLFEDYETYGEATLRTLAVEHQLDVAHQILERGRGYHRAWCARVFAPYLPDPSASHYDQSLLAFIAATDLYCWKLLRKDLRRSRGEAMETMRLLVEGLIR